MARLVILKRNVFEVKGLVRSPVRRQAIALCLHKYSAKAVCYD
jgi:hypothetical protein